MIELKIAVALVTILIGSYYIRKELGALFEIITAREYITLRELRALITKKPNLQTQSQS